MLTTRPTTTLGKIERNREYHSNVNRGVRKALQRIGIRHFVDCVSIKNGRVLKLEIDS